MSASAPAGRQPDLLLFYSRPINHEIILKKKKKKIGE
jgi:hypothetical protein